MKFANWKEAEKRVNEIKVILEEANKSITAKETEARDENLDINKRDALIKDIQSVVEKRDADQKEHDETIIARDRLKVSEDNQFSLLSSLSTPRVEERTAGMGKDVFETREYELAWARYIRTGNDTEVRDLISTVDHVIMVPKTLVNKIEDTLRTGGRILALCSMTAIQGITEYPIAKSRTNPKWHEEKGAKKEKKAVTLTSVSMEPQFIAEILEITRKFEEDSISAFWDWLNAELPDALKRVIDREILYGAATGTNGIRGILTNANTNAEFVATLASHTLGFNTANEAVAELADGAEQNITAVMNKRTFLKDVMGLVGTDGHPIYQQVMNTNTNKPSYFIGGYPIVFTDELPDYATAIADDPYMLFGDFSAMRLNFPSGMNVRLIRDELTRKSENVIEYLSEIYVGGNITRLGSFVKVTK